MKYPIYRILILALILAPPSAMAASGSGGGMPQQQQIKRLTPEEKAVVSYQRGLKHRDKAARYEQKAIDENNDRKFAKLQKKIAKEYKKAIDDMEKAISYNPQFYQAHSSVGYALRKINRYDESLAAYNESLRINPSYHEAVEYRGEAYLGLNRLDDAKSAYMALFQSNRPLADQLMAAMISWVAARRDDAGALDAASVEQFAMWVDQRNRLASYIHPMDGDAGIRWAVSI